MAQTQHIHTTINLLNDNCGTHDTTECGPQLQEWHKKGLLLSSCAREKVKIENTSC